jgi:hypothetical protein
MAALTAARHCNRLVAIAGVAAGLAISLPAVAETATQAVLQTAPVAASRLAPDLQTLIATIGARLGGADPADLERGGVYGSLAIRSETGFLYHGFAVKHVNIDQYSQSRTDPSRFVLAGELGWQDPVGRRTVSAFRVIYRTADGRTDIEQAEWKPRYADRPVTRAFVIPADAGARIEAALQAGFASAYMVFRTAALNTTIVPDKTYVLGVFVLDRLRADGEFELRLSDNRDGPEGDAAPFRYRIFEPGWAAGITGVSGRALLADQPKWIKAVWVTKGQGLFASDHEDVLALFRVPKAP